MVLRCDATMPRVVCPVPSAQQQCKPCLAIRPPHPNSPQQAGDEVIDNSSKVDLYGVVRTGVWESSNSGSWPQGPWGKSRRASARNYNRVRSRTASERTSLRHPTIKWVQCRFPILRLAISWNATASARMLVGHCCPAWTASNHRSEDPRLIAHTYP